MKKKVVHVTFNMGIGGAERVIANLVENTDAARFDVSVLCLEQPVGPFGQKLRKKGYRVDSLYRRPGFDIRLLAQVREYLVQERVDILHCHQYTPYVYGVLAAAFHRIKVIFTEHGRFHPDRRRLKRVLLNPLLSKCTDHLTAISLATRAALIRFENFPGHRISVIYNGIVPGTNGLPVNGSLRDALGIPVKAHVLGSVGRLDPIKNQAMMLRVLKQLLEKYPDTFLVLVGDGPERENLQELTRRLKLTSRVIFAGYQADPQLYYGIMDIFLLTSHSEGTAMTLLEAMAAGLPCVVTDAGGNAEIIENDGTGLVVPRGCEEDLANRITRLLADNANMSKFGEAARQRFEKEFTAKKMTRSYETLYDTAGRLN